MNSIVSVFSPFTYNVNGLKKEVPDYQKIAVIALSAIVAFGAKLASSSSVIYGFTAFVMLSTLCKAVEKWRNKSSFAELSFEKVLSLLDDKGAANLRLFAIEPDNCRGIKLYRPARKEEIESPPAPPNINHAATLPYNTTTTLANIICSNAFHFQSEAVLTLVRKLIQVKADFQAIDYSSCPVCWYIQNNPLKHLIALGSMTTAFDEATKELITYIGTLEENEKQTIFTHKDNYPLGNIPLAAFLIRQGKEDLVFPLVKAGYRVSEEELILAAKSFATSKRSVMTEDGLTCLELLKNQCGTITPATKQQCLEALNYYCPSEIETVKEKLAATLQQRMKEWIKEMDGMGRKIAECMGVSQEEFQRQCADETNQAKVLEAYAFLMAYRPHMMELLHDEFRVFEMPGTTAFMPETFKASFCMADASVRSKLEALIDEFKK